LTLHHPCLCTKQRWTCHTSLGDG